MLFGTFLFVTTALPKAASVGDNIVAMMASFLTIFHSFYNTGPNIATALFMRRCFQLQVSTCSKVTGVEPAT
jgi:hypothetical protein